MQPVRPLAPERGIRSGDVAVRADAAALATLLDRSRSGELPVRVAGSGPLDQAAALYATVGAGGSRGRRLLRP